MGARLVPDRHETHRFNINIYIIIVQIKEPEWQRNTAWAV